MTDTLATTISNLITGKAKGVRGELRNLRTESAITKRANLLLDAARPSRESLEAVAITDEIAARNSERFDTRFGTDYALSYSIGHSPTAWELLKGAVDEVLYVAEDVTDDSCDFGNGFEVLTALDRLAEEAAMVAEALTA